MLGFWRALFPKRELVIPPKPPEPILEREMIYVSAFHHERVAYMMDPRRSGIRSMDPDSRFENPLRSSFPELTSDAKAWLDANTPGYSYAPSRVANFMMEIEFANPNDAVKFKLFWM